MESQIPKCYFIIHAQWGKAACSPMECRMQFEARNFTLYLDLDLLNSAFET